MELREEQELVWVKCQSGFCSTKIVALLSKELGIPETEVTKFGGKSNLLIGEDKEI